MRFDNHQQELLSNILDSLLCYINGRFHIVRDAIPSKELDRQLRSQLIERFLWEHRELIGDYVRDNPDNLTQSQLDIAAGLSGTLYGTLYLESRGKGSAVISHLSGSYTVASPNDSFFTEFPEGPLEVRGAIAPFCGIIVPIPPFAVMGSVSSSHLSHLHEDLRKRGAERPTDDARILAGRVRAWECASLRDNTSERASQGRATGFHKGVLSGLNDEQRRQAILDHTNRAQLGALGGDQVLAALSIRVDEYPQTLQEALLQLDSDWVFDIAQDLSEEPLPPTLPTQRLFDLIGRHISEEAEELSLVLTWCSDEQFDLVKRLRSTNPLVLDELPPSLSHHLYPMIPFSFIFRKGVETVAWMSPEASAALTKVDLTAVDEVRQRMRQACQAARGMATMCGIISISDLYERYRRAVSQPLSRIQFETALEEFECCESRDDYARWRHHCCDYVISVELSDASACARVTRECYANHILDREETPGSRGKTLVVGLTPEDEDEFMRLVSQKEAELERTRMSLLGLDRPQRAPELPASMLHEGPIPALMQLDALKALRSFVDAHIPNDQDEYEFADLFCRSVIVSAVLMCESYNQTMDIIRLYHMETCEGDTYSDTLGRLVTNAFNALPRWDLNGWSLEQNTERLTGRRRFFNADGTERIIGRNDPCPCGSGKPYRCCCGHLYT